MTVVVTGPAGTAWEYLVVIDRAADIHSKCLDVTALVQASPTEQGGGRATFFGNAEVDSGSSATADAAV